LRAFSLTENKQTISDSINEQQSFYKRELSSKHVYFASKEGKELFKQAFLTGGMENYFCLAEQFTT
jgi:glutathione gamma-glutamylcysteinyltransferase